MLMLAVQRIFEKAGCTAQSQGLAKSLVWRFLGGALPFQIQIVGRILQNTIVYTCPFFHYAMALSIKFPGAQSSAFQIVEQCGVGVWAEENDDVRNLHIAGATDAVWKALERFRAVRTNKYPDCIVVRDPVQLYFDDDGETTTEQQQGLSSSTSLTQQHKQQRRATRTPRCLQVDSLGQAPI